MAHKPDRHQVSFLHPEGATLLHLVRENLRLLAELSERYEVAQITPSLEQQVIHKPADVAGYLGPEMATLAQEQLRVILLDIKNHVLGTCLVYQGGLNSVVIRLADCFREAVACGAAAVILIHNHPSGDPTPSADDVRLTRDAGQAGELLGIDVLDHVILGRPGFVSLRNIGLYTPTRGMILHETGRCTYAPDTRSTQWQSRRYTGPRRARGGSHRRRRAGG